jgi:hypothetical protein
MEDAARRDLQAMNSDSTDAGRLKSKILAEASRQVSLSPEENTQHDRYQMRGFDKSN